MTTRPVVVRVITWLPVGGIERRIVTVAPRLRDRGWEVRVVCLREEGPLAEQLRQHGIPVKVIRFRSRLSPIGLFQLRRYLIEHDAKVLHSHMYRANVPATIAGRLAGTPAIFAQIHNVASWDTPRQQRLDRALARWRTGTICVSHAVQGDVQSALQLTDEQTPLLYNGIDMDAFHPDQAARQTTRAILEIEPARLVILAPARLHPQKNPLGVLEAFREVLKELPQPGPLLLFAGGGKLEQELREKSADLRANVHLLGERDDMAALYNASDVVVLSSFKEGFSNAIIEAMAAGKPVIASDVGGNAEAVQHGVSGWIHDAGDTEGLRRQLLEVCRLGQMGLAAMSHTCRETASQFSIDNLVEATHRLYCKALGREP